MDMDRMKWEWKRPEVRERLSRISAAELGAGEWT